MQFLHSAGRSFGAIVLVSDLLASVWIFGLMMLMISDVLMRFVFNAPITGVNEIMEISIVAMLYMQVTQALSDAVRHGLTHIDTVNRDAVRLQRKTGCCVPTPGDVAGVSCCAGR